MPLTKLQLSALEVLKPFRTENTFIGGGAALNQQWARISDDLDIFDDRRKVLPEQVAPELEKLREAGFSIEIINEDQWMVEAVLRKFGFETKIQWMDEPETSRRFFPAILDAEFGYRLHQADAAVNKVLCASRRNSAARDAVDLVAIVENYAPLGPMIWALAAKDVDIAPPQIIRDIRKNVFGYADDEIRTVRLENEATSRAHVRSVLEPALDQAAAYCDERAPEDYLGQLFVDQTEIPIEADLEILERGEAVALEIKDFGVLPTIAN